MFGSCKVNCGRNPGKTIVTALLAAGVVAGAVYLGRWLRQRNAPFDYDHAYDNPHGGDDDYAVGI